MFFAAREFLVSTFRKRVDLKLVTFLLPEAYLEGLDRLVEVGRYESRSEAVRYAVKEMMKRELWRIKAERTLRKRLIAKIKV